MEHFSGMRKGAYLQASDGRIVLSLNSQQYSADDLLPEEIEGVEMHGTRNARRYVNACMIVEYGRHEKSWPELARRFVLGG